MRQWDRRGFLAGLGLGLGAPYLLTVTGCGTDLGLSVVPSSLVLDDGRVFDLSVASGDPSVDGVVLWTHLKPSALVPGQPLHFQVATDAGFASLVAEGSIDARDFGPDSDHTARVDLAGLLAPGIRYFYRFVYGDRSSATGRCRTLPSGGLARLKLGLLTCQDFSNGYYGAFKHLASDDSLDFVLHLGDFIYESVGDPRFQQQPFADRRIVLPSASPVALGLNDYRALYRTYRGDVNLQRMLEQHTLIAAPDDHETANDCYWDYARDTLGAPDHPFKDPAQLTRLKLDSQQAWLEYLPARVMVDRTASHPHRFSRVYREFAFGDLVRLNMLDTRTYRSAHPCGEGDYFQRYLPLGCDGRRGPARSLLGADQRAWLVDRLTSGGAFWKLVGNQTFFGQLSAVLGGGVPINVDAWDGYETERRQLAEELRRQGVKNLVFVTGDLHSYVASHIKVDYRNLNPFDSKNFLGVEFMTPAVTSAALLEMLAGGMPSSGGGLLGGLATAAIRVNNPHISFFDSASYGYSTLELTRSFAEWTAYAVDKTMPADAPRRALARLRKLPGSPYLQSLRA